MSLLQEPVAIILYLELELSHFMRLHEVFPYDKRGKDFSDLEDPFPFCVQRWSWVSLGLNPKQNCRVNVSSGAWRLLVRFCRTRLGFSMFVNSVAIPLPSSKWKMMWHFSSCWGFWLCYLREFFCVCFESGLWNNWVNICSALWVKDIFITSV